jgi:preprotein translocase subunit SecF
MFTTFLFKNWQLIVIGILLIALAGSGIYAKMLNSDIDKLKAEKETLTIKLQVSNASIDTLRKSIYEQNSMVEKFKADAVVREKASRNEIVKAKVESANQKKRAEDLMTREIPKDTTACTAANELFDEEIKNGK